MVVVVSGSREHFQMADGLDSRTHPVLITAPPDRLRARLASRGRETAQQAVERLGRADAYEVADARLVTILNDGALDDAAGAFVRLVATLASADDDRRRA